MKAAPLVVLLVDDDEAFAAMCSRLLASRGIQVTHTPTPLGASNLARRLRPDLVLLDVELPALTGDALVALLRRSGQQGMRIVLYSAHDDETLRVIARRTQADGWISKSADIDTVSQYLGRVARHGGHVA